MVIYKYTNLINGKAYVGQTVDEKNRKKSHLLAVKQGSTVAFHQAIRKYGIDSFKYEVIDGANSESELNYKEVHHIHMTNSMVPSGYNMKLGQECIDRLKRPVIGTCIVSGKATTYRSVSSCERILCIPRNTVYEILNGKREYRDIDGINFSYVDSEPVKKVIKIKQEYSVKRICNFTKEVKHYNNARETAKDGFNPRSVRNACMRVRQIRNRSVGYTWEYVK